MVRVAKPRIDVRYKVRTYGTQVPKRIILHSWESAGTIEGIAAFWERQGLGLGSQFMIESSGRIGQGAPSDRKCAHTRGANYGSIGVELEGFARSSKRRWMRDNRRQLDELAHLLAYLSYRWGIQLKRSTSSGVCLHADFPAGGHWDPGPGFPLRYVLRRARRILKGKASVSGVSCKLHGDAH